MADQPTDLFSEKPESTSPGTPPQNLDVNTLLSMIVNEDGKQKYASIEEALKGAAHAQAYIPSLKTELETERQKRVEAEGRLKSQSDLEAALEQLAAKRAEHGSELPPVIPSGLDEQKVQDIVKNYFESTAATIKANENRQLVINELTKKFGEKAKDVIATRAAELGTTPDDIGKLATSNPNLVLALFQTNAPSKGATSTPPPSINIPGLPTDEALQPPAKSLLRGASNKEQVEYLRKIKAEVYKKHGITE